MAAPMPPEALPGGEVYIRKADEVYRHYTNIARLANDIINVDAAVNLVKVADIAFVHAKLLDDNAQDASDEFKSAVELHFAAAGLEWPTRNDMVTDINAIRVECNAFRTWVDTNLAAAKTPATVTYSMASTSSSQVADTVPNTDPVFAEVQKIRDLYA